jgi:hypothetical protein
MQTAAALLPATADTRWSTVVWPHLELEEGTRFTCIKGDDGGATKFGLTLTFLQNEARIDPSLFAELGVGHGGVITVADVEALTADQAQAIYFHCIWRALMIDELPAPFDCATMDQVVNDGQETGVKLLQTAINSVWEPYGDAEPAPKVDGVLGSETISACVVVCTPSRGTGAQALLFALRSAAAARYHAIVDDDPSQAEFLDGWLKRAAALGSV